MIADNKDKVAKINAIYENLIEKQTTTVKDHFTSGQDVEIHKLLSTMPTHAAILLNFRVASVCPEYG